MQETKRTPEGSLTDRRRSTSLPLLEAKEFAVNCCRQKRQLITPEY
jgi:hypothetical protein